MDPWDENLVLTQEEPTTLWLDGATQHHAKNECSKTTMGKIHVGTHVNHLQNIAVLLGRPEETQIGRFLEIGCLR